MAMGILFDNQLHNYLSFFDHEWAKDILVGSRGSPFAEPVFSLTMTWKALANTSEMPYLNVHTIIAFNRGYRRAEKAMSDQLVNEVGGALETLGGRRPVIDRATLAAAVGTSRVQMQQVYDNAEDFDAQELFTEFLNRPGGTELKLGIWGSQRTVYGALFHAYECFILQCISAVAPDRAAKLRTLGQTRDAIVAAFDKQLATDCFNGDDFDYAAEVRNALAHHGGRETDRVKKCAHGLRVEGGILQFMPDDNRRLFESLKAKAALFVERAVKLHPNVVN